MMRKEAAQIIADIAKRPVTTVENNLIPKLQAAGLAQGEVDASYRVNVLLGILLDREHGVTPPESVRHWRALPLVARSDESLAETLGISLKNAGTALDSILETVLAWPDAGSPIFKAKRERVEVSVEFCDDNQMVITFGRGKRQGATVTFGLPDATTGQAERIVRIPHAAFERLAQP
jgi:hypothetical protein